jgi:hypothetical protein
MTLAWSCVSGVLVLAPVALAKGDNAGSLGAGGHARGDISHDTGETDRVTVSLDEGALLDVTFSASFAAAVAVTGPEGQPVELAGASGSKWRVVDRPVTASGAYVFAIASGDGSQGVYTLAVRQRWERAVAIAGTGAATVDVDMPAGGTLACVVRGAAGASGHPRIAGLEDPAGQEMLQAPVVAGRVVKLPPQHATVAGVYHLKIDATDGTSAWTGRVLRVVPKPAPTALDLTNGLDVVSFSGDGVARVFSQRCGQCHGWALSYVGVREFIGRAMPRILGGSMPPGGRLPASEVALIRTWIKTGKAR